MNHNHTHEAGAHVLASSMTGGNMKTDTEHEKAEAALGRIKALARYLETLAPGDQHYATLIREALGEEA